MKQLKFSLFAISILAFGCEKSTLESNLESAQDPVKSETVTEVSFELGIESDDLSELVTPLYEQLVDGENYLAFVGDPETETITLTLTEYGEGDGPNPDKQIPCEGDGLLWAMWCLDEYLAGLEYGPWAPCMWDAEIVRHQPGATFSYYTIENGC